MRNQILFISFVLFFSILFAGLNWSLFTSVSTLNLLFTEIEAPLGLVLLIIIFTISFIFIVMVGIIQTGAMIKGHRISKELEKARKLAETEEISRYNDLKMIFRDQFEAFNSEIKNLKKQLEQSGIISKAKREDKGFFNKFKKSSNG